MSVLTKERDFGAALVRREALLNQVRADAEEAYERLHRSLSMLEDAGHDRLAEPVCEAANAVVTVLEYVQREMRAQSCSPYPLDGHRLAGPSLKVVR